MTKNRRYGECPGCRPGHSPLTAGMEGAMQELSLATLGPTVEKNAVVVVEFWAPWCTTCARFTPVYKDVAAHFDDVIFGTVNTDEHQQLAAIMGVRSLPTLVVFRDGKHVFAKSGVTTRRHLIRLIEHIRVQAVAPNNSRP